ncbi:MAG: GNAT family N-acetyltransferase [Anaerolineaceae bacterium]|nr:GNAT family N-acetyltransferase [Anaerolineaceae bacterium]
MKKEDRSWVRAEIQKWWGNEMIVLRKTKYYPTEMDGFIALVNGEKAGLVLLRHEGVVCEIMSLTKTSTQPGVGKKLMRAAIADAKEHHAERMIVVTTNDNIDALRFYQKAGFCLHILRKGILAESRKIKPEIPLSGYYNIPIRDEIELEMIL